jgi:hypothetical protein
VDQGFRGKDHHPQDVEVLVCVKLKRTSRLRKLLKRQGAIEPVIGHAKSDHGLGHNYLKGQVGGSLNALLAGYGFNLRIDGSRSSVCLSFTISHSVFQGQLFREGFSISTYQEAD